MHDSPRINRSTRPRRNPMAFSTATSVVRSRIDMAMALPATSDSEKTTARPMLRMIRLNVAQHVGEHLRESGFGLRARRVLRAGELAVDGLNDVGNHVGAVRPWRRWCRSFRCRAPSFAAAPRPGTSSGTTANRCIVARRTRRNSFRSRSNW